MGAFLCFMAVRLLAMRRVLKPIGSIYLHCDPTASHYLKELLDAVFGHDCFQNEIIWQKVRSSKGQTKGFGSVHDTIFAYRKTRVPFLASSTRIPFVPNASPNTTGKSSKIRT